MSEDSEIDLFKAGKGLIRVVPLKSYSPIELELLTYSFAMSVKNEVYINKKRLNSDEGIFIKHGMRTKAWSEQDDFLVVFES